MLRRSWFHWSLSLLALALFFALALIMSGSGNAMELKTQILKLLEQLDPKHVGLVGSASGASYGLLQLYLQTERRLPGVLSRFLVRCQQRITQHRSLLLAEFENRVAAAVEGNTWADRMRLRLLQWRLRNYIDDIDTEPISTSSNYAKLVKRQEIASRAFKQVQEEMATAHLLRGLKCSKAADEGVDRDNSRRKAVAELRKAASFDKSDPQVFRACVSELEKTSNRDGLLELATGWAESAAQCGYARQEGVARTLLARCMFDERKGEDRSVKEIESWLRKIARPQIDTACSLLEQHCNPGETSSTDRELAIAFELSGDIETEIQAPANAGHSYGRALSIYRAIGDLEAIDRLRGRLTEIRRPDNVSTSSKVAAVLYMEAHYKLAEANLVSGNPGQARLSISDAHAYLAERIPDGLLSDTDRKEWIQRIEQVRLKAEANIVSTA